MRRFTAFRVFSVSSLVVFAIGCGSTPTGGNNPGSGTADTGNNSDIALNTDAAKTDGTANPDTATGVDGVGDATSGEDGVVPTDVVPSDDALVDNDTIQENDNGGGADATPVEGCKTDDDCKANAVPACKKSVCQATKCVVADAADDSTCDDSNVCTEKEVCKAGACQGVAISCDDKEPCTDDTCDPVKNCQHANNTSQCDDGDGCTKIDACKDGKCAGVALDCDDKNPCTDDTCDKAKGCAYTKNTADCSDGSACTAGDKCADGACVGGSVVVCDDKNPCTTDSCDVKSGCATAPVAQGALCDDADACSSADTCKDGKCAGIAVVCDDKNACTADTCDKAKGCVNTADDKAVCDDGNSCSTGDACKAGVCAGVGKVCDDSNPCTDDSCKDNACIFTNNTVACDDKDSCTQGDGCVAGACVSGKPLVCDDKNPCTTDTCDKATGSCTFTNNVLACDDKSACTSADVCKAGACGGTPVVCDDKNVCTTDSCDSITGKCVYTKTADGNACEDGSACTQKDACAAGVCVGVKLTCDDSNACTTDTCDPIKGCLTAPNVAKCDDGNACTTSDTCADNKCVGGPAALCDDANKCTDDSCDTGKGCLHVNNNANVCTDSNACTDADVCKDGICGGVVKVCNDNVLCTNDSCDPAKGCVFTNNTALCTDGSVCTSDDACKDGKCVGGAVLKCDDGNPCTADTCDAKLACQFKAVADKTVCDDGNGCTTADACTAGKCAGAGKNCDDSNPCTDDTCTADVCKSTPNKAFCTDGNSCTQLDQCDGAGKCVGSNPLKCDDGNLCTTDACVNQVGCTATNNTIACEDGVFCTAGDACLNGKCASGPPKSCDDNNVCTNDACVELSKACAYTNNLKNCDDLNPCTTNPDVCGGGKCVPGAAKICDDHNPCTTDSCDIKTGNCVYVINAGLGACPSVGVPYIGPIDANDIGWFGWSSSKSVKWATDATPAGPGKLSGAASLNFNNGTDYFDKNVVGTVNGTAVSTFFVDATKLVGPFMTLDFYSWADVANSNTLDKRTVELSTDGFNTIAKSFQFDNSKNKKIWYLEALDIKELIGKKFQIRFKFDATDAGATGATGWFVDELNVYAGPVVTMTPGKAFSDAMDNNNSGWQFSAANAQLTGWAVDATNAIPGGFSGSSLNFNNGTDYAGVSNAWTLAPVIDLEAATGEITLWFKEWVDVEASNAWDQRFVEISTDNWNTVGGTLLSKQFDNAANVMGGWRWNQVSLTAYKGKKFKLRFRVNSVDDFANSTKGWFIDDLVLDNKPTFLFADMITCSNLAAWTINNGNLTGAHWGVDATGIAPLSKDCSLNFNALNAAVPPAYDFVCPKGITKMSGTAKSGAFLLSAAVGAKSYLAFTAFWDTEAIANNDQLSVTVTAVGGVAQTFLLDKSNGINAWKEFLIDISPFQGKSITLTFAFDSINCTANTGTGVAIENVAVRNDK